MAPEYNKVYIPPEHAAEFELFVGQIEGADIGRKSLRNRDFPPPTAEDLGIDELGQRAKMAITLSPTQTRLTDLQRWYWPETAKKDLKIHTPEAWIEFMHSLMPEDKKLVSRAINGFARQAPLLLKTPEPTIDELREIDWAKAPWPRNVGLKGMTFLSAAFSK